MSGEAASEAAVATETPCSHSKGASSGTVFNQPPSAPTGTKRGREETAYESNEVELMIGPPQKRVVLQLEEAILMSLVPQGCKRSREGTGEEILDNQDAVAPPRKKGRTKVPAKRRPGF